MRILHFLTILAILLAFSVPAAPAAAQTATRPLPAEISPDTLYVPGEVIVGFSDAPTLEATTAQAQALAGQVGAQVVDAFANVALLQFEESADVPALVSQLSGVQGVAYAEPNYVRWIPEMQMDPTKVVGHPQPRTEVTFRLREPNGGSGTRELKLSLSELRSMKSIRNGLAVPTWPTDPGVWTQWGWYYSDAHLIWPDKAANPAVCVVDTGVDRNHPDLKILTPTGWIYRVLPGYDFVNEDANPADDNGHGTHVSGTITAVINNKKGFAGISTAKIVPAKVLSAQGWGTDFDIAQGIRYCANNTAVKVINMSLGGAGVSMTEYNALDYAINTKGKLVVAAAGNDSMAYIDWNGDNAINPGTADGPASFPAGWAVDWVCKDGTLAPSAPTTADCASGNANALAHGLLSVAAANSPWGFWNDTNGDGLVWVDVNGDTSEPPDGDPTYWSEHFWPDYCAAEFSNYGAWVEIMAPGKDIYSTVPVSYNYHDRYFWGADEDGDGYDSWSGTSMATPHVAGAAARVWSAFPSYTNAAIETKLAHGGISMFWRALAMDPQMGNAWEGYNTTYGGEAPFCWPDSTKGPLYDMTNVPYLDVAGVMNRTALWQPVSEAITGLPLAGATVMAYSGTTLKDKAIVSRDNRWVALLNLPASGGYTIKVSKAGYTNGAVDIYPGEPPQSCWPGYWGCDLWTLAIPPMGRITAVADWGWSSTDLDLYAWLPTVSSSGGVVGAGASGHLDDLGPGLLSDFPRARRNRDGGWSDWLPSESISIVPRPGFPTMPYYNQTAGDFYDFLLTDYGQLSDPTNPTSGFLNQDVFFRVWVGGKIVGFVEKAATCDTDGADNILGNADDEVWWYAGSMQFGAFTVKDQCGPAGAAPGGIWPYAASGQVIYSVPENPKGK